MADLSEGYVDPALAAGVEEPARALLAASAELAAKIYPADDVQSGRLIIALQAIVRECSHQHVVDGVLIEALAAAAGSTCAQTSAPDDAFNLLCRETRRVTVNLLQAGVHAQPFPSQSLN